MRGERPVTRESSTDPIALALATRVCGRAGEYFGTHGGTAEITSIKTLVRPTSRLYRFDVRLGGNDYGVQVKMPVSSAAPADGTGSSGEERPRIAPLIPGLQALRFEHEALSRIHDHFHPLHDVRFGAVRVLEWLPQQPAIVMEMLNEPSLRALWLGHRPGRRTHGPRDLHAAFRHAGSWLRVYHALPAPAVQWTVHARRAEFTHFVEELTGFLAQRTGNPRFFDSVATRVAAAASAYMPETLPVGLLHGDFAMRNVLVGRGQRVTVIDTRSLCRTASFRDIGYFLGDLRCSILGALARGAVFQVSRHREYRNAFLAGYFGNEAVPSAVVTLFEIQHLLERWSAAVARVSASRRPAPLRDGMQLLLTAFFRETVEGRLRALAGEPALEKAARSWAS
jgi:aminoglycoside phosphotransferase (APT) family kinase protein